MTPGIGFIMVIGLSLQRGWHGTIWAVVGLAVGIVILQVAGLSGMGLLVANNPTLYAAVKVAGALVLFYLSWHSWKKAGHGAIAVNEHTEPTHDTYFLKSVLISITNPQPLVFTISVFPQFIALDRPYVPQVVIMIAVYAVMVASYEAGYLVYLVLVFIGLVLTLLLDEKKGSEYKAMTAGKH